MVSHFELWKFSCLGNQSLTSSMIYIFNIFPQDSAGSGFDDYGGELELHMMNFSDRSASTTLVGRAKATYISFFDF
jgi:hypothetical protein